VSPRGNPFRNDIVANAPIERCVGVQIERLKGRNGELSRPQKIGRSDGTSAGGLFTLTPYDRTAGDAGLTIVPYDVAVPLYPIS
jgi:hypothetical protein